MAVRCLGQGGDIKTQKSPLSSFGVKYFCVQPMENHHASNFSRFLNKATWFAFQKTAQIISILLNFLGKNMEVL